MIIFMQVTSIISEHSALTKFINPTVWHSIVYCKKLSHVSLLEYVKNNIHNVTLFMLSAAKVCR